jgi:hypothetical protein
MPDWPEEPRLLEEVTLRLIETGERERFDECLEQEHYLHNAKAIGAVLRYVATYRGQWVALLTFNSAALYLKPRDRFLNWSARQVAERRHLVAQNSRFLVLPTAGRWPNLASRLLKLAGERLPEDWRLEFGHPVLLAETFVDPQRFRGTCYQAAGWQALGQTKGFARRGQDFYLDQKHPKELWVRPLGPAALDQLRAESLPPELASGRKPPPPPPPVPTGELASLWEFVRREVSDSRRRRGLRHPVATLVCLATLAVAAGCRGPHAIAEFAQSLNHCQRRHLRCRPRPGAPRQYEVPCERTFRRFLQGIDPDELRVTFTAWMATLDPRPVRILHLDGKVVRNADPAPPRLPEDPRLAAAAAAVETPVELQKPKAEKALTLVNFLTPDQRLIDQIAVPRDTNEEAAVAAHLAKLDLAGVIVMFDAAHSIKANCHQIAHQKGGEYISPLKGNQPHALAKAKQLLAGDTPPSGQHARQRSRADRTT